MTMINVTPSTGKQSAVSIDLNRLRLRTGDRVVYYSDERGEVRIDVIDARAADDGNWFTIDGERLLVTRIFARIPDRCGRGQEAAIIADFASFGRGTLAIYEIMTVCDRQGLDI